MRLIPATALCFVLSAGAFAQIEKLPDILKPDAASQAEAKRMGAKAIKLVPFGMFKDKPSDSFKDEDNPIGIRGGGSTYSFTNESHSYNKQPEIIFDDKQQLHGPFGITLFAELGKRDLSTIDLTSAETAYLLSYNLPKYVKDLSAETTKLFKGIIGGPVILSNSVYFSLECSYLIRAVNFEKSDITVAIRILKIDSDKSITIAWKKLADLPMPFVLEMSDKELQALVDAAIEVKKVVGVNIFVKDNHLYSLGPNHDDAREVENFLTRKGIRFRGAGGVVPKDP